MTPDLIDLDEGKPLSTLSLPFQCRGRNLNTLCDSDIYFCRRCSAWSHPYQSLPLSDFYSRIVRCSSRTAWEKSISTSKCWKINEIFLAVSLDTAVAALAQWQIKLASRECSTTKLHDIHDPILASFYIMQAYDEDTLATEPS